MSKNGFGILVYTNPKKCRKPTLALAYRNIIIL